MEGSEDDNQAVSINANYLKANHYTVEIKRFFIYLYAKN